ncbi:MAG TPA: NAD(P)H-hydrate dehydratase, partial [Chitinophagaceae bacterium]|nr:NAD(P)H-hydrate dehydratase [Chitinophagaceae bacterium]
EFGHKGTDDFQTNLSSLHETKAEIKFIQTEDQLPSINDEEIVIDALLGSGLNRPIEGFTAEVVNHINQFGKNIISIDIPSGLFVDKSSKDNVVVQADHTLTFQCQKLAFLMPENAKYTGKVHILNIGLHQKFLKSITPVYEWMDAAMIRKIYKPRQAFAHKGSHGHAFLIAGSYGKMGAAILCAKACVRSGAGLVTAHTPSRGVDILQITVPEAMCDPDRNEWVNQSIVSDLSKFNAIGIGPGMGTDPLTAELIDNLLQRQDKPLVLDADALNIISRNKKLLNSMPPDSVLTPHPKEFERLFGESGNDFVRLEKALEFANALKVIIVLKGHYTFVATPGGRGYFNSSGNPGMATGGTGDVLTGLITGLIAQGYAPLEATLFGIFWHGVAGDYAAEQFSEESMTASDLIEQLGTVILSVINSTIQDEPFLL